MKKCWLKTAALATGCLAFLLGGFSGCKGEIEDFDDDGDASTRVAIDISTNADTKDWTEVAAYVYGGSIGDNGWGNWPGLVLKQSESNPAVFYSDDLSGKKLGNGTIIFNNNNNGSQIEGIEFSISKGQMLLFKAGKFVKAGSADLGISSAGNDSKDGETDSQSGSANSGNNAANADGTSPAAGKSDSASGGNNDATDTGSTNPASGNANDGDESISPASGNAGGNASGNGANESGSTAGEATTQEPASETNDGNGEAEISKRDGNLTIGVSADYYKIASAENVYVWYWGDFEAVDDGLSYPGKKFTKDESLGIWKVVIPVKGNEGDKATVKINLGDDNAIYQGDIKFNETKLYTHAETWIDWDGSFKDSTVAVSAPEPVTDLTSEIIVLAVDVSDLGWSESAPYIWGWTGGFESKTPFLEGAWGTDDYKLTQLKDTKIWFYAISKEFATDNTSTYIQFIPSDKSDDGRIGSTTSLEAGKGYLLKADNGEWTSFTSFNDLISQ